MLDSVWEHFGHHWGSQEWTKRSKQKKAKAYLQLLLHDGSTKYAFRTAWNQLTMTTGSHASRVAGTRKATKGTMHPGLPGPKHYENYEEMLLVDPDRS